MSNGSRTVIGEKPIKGKYLCIKWPSSEPSSKDRYESLDDKFKRKPVLTLGRAKGNDIEIDYELVSRHHADLKLDGDNLIIRNNGRHGLCFKGRSKDVMELRHLDEIYLGQDLEGSVSLQYLNYDKHINDTYVPDPDYLGTFELKGNEIFIGRNEGNTIPLRDPNISRKHAKITRDKDGKYRLEDMGSSVGTYVNGQEIKTSVVLQKNCVIQIGPVQMIYDGDKKLFSSYRRGFELRAENICCEQENSGKLKNVSLKILPGEFVALLGSSGAGKSTVLKTLNGTHRPDKGNVLIEGEDLYLHFNEYCYHMGYVPQADIVHKELTIKEALEYAIRLHSNATKENIEERVNDILNKLLSETEQKNGLKDRLIEKISGGQCKRVNIAVALISDPKVIFLDEPTSGLDPALDREVMDLLRKQAINGKTIVLVTHNVENLDLCSKIAFIVAGGRLAFYGTPAEAKTFFIEEPETKPDPNSVEKIKGAITPVQIKSVQEEKKKEITFAEIYTIISNPEKAQKFVEKYARQTGVSLKEDIENKKIGISVAKSISSGTKIVKKIYRIISDSQEREKFVESISSVEYQTQVLLSRQLKILSKSPGGMLFTFAIPILISALLYFVAKKDIFVKANDFQEVFMAQVVLFLMACAGTFSVLIPLEEIAKEFPIYQRERLINLNIVAYLASKLIVLFGVNFCQAMLMTFIVHLTIGFPSGGVTPFGLMPILAAIPEIIITITLVAFASSCFGLFLSALSAQWKKLGNLGMMQIVIIFLVLQVVLAGVILPLPSSSKSFSAVTFTHWGTKALGSTINMAKLKQPYALNPALNQWVPFDYKYEFGYWFTSNLCLVGWASFWIIATVVILYFGQEIGEFFQEIWAFFQRMRAYGVSFMQKRGLIKRS